MGFLLKMVGGKLGAGLVIALTVSLGANALLWSRLDAKNIKIDFLSSELEVEESRTSALIYQADKYEADIKYNIAEAARRYTEIQGKFKVAEGLSNELREKLSKYDLEGIGFNTPSIATRDSNNGTERVFSQLQKAINNFGKSSSTNSRGVTTENTRHSTTIESTNMDSIRQDE